MDVSNKGCLSVPQEKCLRCSHMVLFDFKGRKEEDCTAENGNDQCPAQGVMVVLGVNVAKAAASIIRAFKANDAADIAAKMQKLSGYHETVQQQVMDEVKLGLAPVTTPSPEQPVVATAEAAAGTGGEGDTAGTGGEVLPEVAAGVAPKAVAGAKAASPAAVDKLVNKFKKPKG